MKAHLLLWEVKEVIGRSQQFPREADRLRKLTADLADHEASIVSQYTEELEAQADDLEKRKTDEH